MQDSLRTTMKPIDSLIQDYLPALRVLDLEGAFAFGHETTAAYRRVLLHCIAELDVRSRNPAPGPAPNRTIGSY